MVTFKEEQGLQQRGKGQRDTIEVKALIGDPGLSLKVHGISRVLHGVTPSTDHEQDHEQATWYGP